MNKKPFITLKVLNYYGEVIAKVRTSKKRRVYLFLQARRFKDCLFDLCVRYSRDYKNEGNYNTKEDLVFALRAFTDPSLVKDFL